MSTLESPTRRFGRGHQPPCTPAEAEAKLADAFRRLAARPYTRRDLRRTFIAVLARSSRRHRHARRPGRSTPRAQHRPAVQRHGGAQAGGDDGGGSNEDDDHAPSSVTAPPSINLIRFPLRRIGAVIVVREHGEWLSIAGGNGWAFGSFADACAEAQWLSQNMGLPVRVLRSVP